METRKDRRFTSDWECGLVRMSEVNVFVSTRTQETRSDGHPAWSDRASPATETRQPGPTSRDGSCAARQNEEDVMKLRYRYDFSRQFRLVRRIADSSYIRVITVLASETGSGAQSAMLTWSDAKALGARCAFIPAS